MKILARIIVLIMFSIVMSGCFVVLESDRSAVIRGLGDSVWPFPSGVYSYKVDGKGEKNRIIRRKILNDGSKAYVIDGDAGFYALYLSDKDTLIAEYYYSDKNESYFSYVKVFDSYVFGSYDQQCEDLTVGQRKSLFGKEEVSKCRVSNYLELITLIKLAKANSKISSIYKYLRPVEDAF